MDTMIIIFISILAVVFAVVVFIVLKLFYISRKLAGSVKELEELSSSGDMNAICKLGYLYFDGTYGIKKDIDKAIPYLKLASDKGVDLASFILAGVYLEGKEGVKKDIKLGFEYLIKSADLGNKVASRMIGLEYSKDGGFLGKDIKKSAKYFLISAEHGDIMSQKIIAGIYRFTAGFDKKIAYAWYKVVATSGDKISYENAETLYNEFAPAEKVEADKIADEYIKRLALYHSAGVEDCSITAQQGIDNLQKKS